jgi:hypothetical protein
METDVFAKWSPDFELNIFAIDCSGTFRLGPSRILADSFEHLMTRTHWQAGVYRGRLSFRKVTWRIRAFVSRPHGGPAFVDGSVGYSACATTNSGPDWEGLKWLSWTAGSSSPEIRIAGESQFPAKVALARPLSLPE